MGAFEYKNYHKSKNKNLKIDFSFVSEHSASWSLKKKICRNFFNHLAKRKKKVVPKETQKKVCIKNIDKKVYTDVYNLVYIDKKSIKYI